ncbi:hypothetical protein Tco_1542766, partial [Tanacetum coccineum]
PKKVRKNNDALIIEDYVSDDEEQDESKTKPEKKTIIPTAAKIEKPVKKLVRTLVNTVRPRIVNTARSYRTPVNTIRPRVINTARQNRTSLNAARANGFNVVNPSACWVWRPIKPNSASITLNRYNYIDARGSSNGCSRHMTGNIAYLSDFKQFDGGYVAFGGGAYGGKISVSAGTVSNVSAGTSEENSQDCILMPIWKDSSYFDSSTENVDKVNQILLMMLKSRMKMD